MQTARNFTDELFDDDNEQAVMQDLKVQIDIQELQESKEQTGQFNNILSDHPDDDDHLREVVDGINSNHPSLKDKLLAATE